MTTDRDQGFQSQAAGDLAELEFQKLAIQAGLNVVQAVPDRAGWDFTVEMREPLPAPALDLRPTVMRWKVQVKSVRDRSPAKISLSNWHRMATDVGPWFVFVALVRGGEVTARWLTHIDENQVARALKRMREVSASRRPEAKIKLALSPQAADELAPPTGPELARRLRDATGQDAGRYAARKQEVIQSAGYGLVRQYGVMQIEKSRMRELAEMAVGRRTSVQVQSVSIHDLRFDVPIKVHERGPALLKGGPVPSLGRTRIALTLPTGEVVQSADFDTRSARLFFPEIPPEDDALAFERPHLKLVLRGDLRTFQIQLDLRDFKKPSRLEDFGPSCEVLCTLLSPPPEGLRLTAKFERGPPLDLEPGALPKIGDIERAYIQAFADASWVARRIGLVDVGLVVPEDLALQNATLESVRNALNGHTTWWSGAVAPETTLEPGLTGSLVIRHVDLGEHTISVAITCVGSGILEERAGVPHVYVAAGRLAVIRQAVLPRSAARERRAQLESEWESAGDVLLTEQGAVNHFLFRN